MHLELRWFTLVSLGNSLSDFKVNVVARDSDG